MTTTPRILLVEDDPDQASLFANVLQMSGYDVETAGDAETALVYLAGNAVTLVLVDWDLPGMKGDAFIGLVQERYPGIKTVLFSNHPEVTLVATACGADAGFRKIEGITPFRRLVTDLAPLGAGSA